MYINFYKTGNDKRKYVKVVLLMTLIALVYNLIAVLLYRNIESGIIKAVMKKTSRTEQLILQNINVYYKAILIRIV